MNKSIELHVNGAKKVLEADPQEPLLYILRNDLALKGPKFGCGLHQCGSCMVLSDGEASYTCRIPCAAFEGKKIQTIEGLTKNENLHPIQEAFFDVQAAQCGYCVNGMIIAALALVQDLPKPSEEEIKEALSKVICRCGTHSRFVSAIKKFTSTT